MARPGDPARAGRSPGRPPSRPGAPQGETEVRAALLDAAADLFAERGPQFVSIRHIADRAGVNHGLVHYYFGSKDALLAAALDRCAQEVADELAHLDDPTALYAPTPATVRHARIAAHVLLDAGDPARIQTDFPSQRVLVAGLRKSGFSESEARERAAQVSAMVLGWILFGDFLTSAARLDTEPVADGTGPGEDALLRRAVTRLVS